MLYFFSRAWGQTAVCLHRPGCRRDGKTLALWTGLCPSLHDDTADWQVPSRIWQVTLLNLAQEHVSPLSSMSPNTPTRLWTWHLSLYSTGRLRFSWASPLDMQWLALSWVYSQWLMHPPWSRGRFWWFNLLLELTVLCAAVKVFHRFWGLPRACTVPEDWSIVGWSPMHPRKLIYTSLKKYCSVLCVMCCVNTLCLTCSISHSLRWSIM